MTGPNTQELENENPRCLTLSKTVSLLNLQQVFTHIQQILTEC